MIDDATSRWFARFVTSGSTVENRSLLERYVKEHGRPLAYYTGQAALFQTAVKIKRDESRAGKDRGSCHRRRSAGRCRSWESPGYLRTAPGEREGRARIFDRPGPAGERHACGGSDHLGASHPLPGNRVSALGQRYPGGGAGQCRRCPPAAGEAPRFSRHRQLIEQDLENKHCGFDRPQQTTPSERPHISADKRPYHQTRHPSSPPPPATEGP